MSTTLPEQVVLTGGADNEWQPEPPGFLSAYPGYRSTALLDGRRASDYAYLDAAGDVYLDYAGAGLPAQAQLAAHAERMRGRCFGNPHSENPASVASSELIERARRAVLAHFNAPPEEYAAIFPPNATGACRLVGEGYPFGPGARLVLTCDNHNSVNGIREFARSRGARRRADFDPYRMLLQPRRRRGRVQPDQVGLAQGAARNWQNDGSVPRAGRHAQRRVAAGIGRPGLQRRRRGATGGIPRVRVPRSVSWHRWPSTTAGLLSRRRPSDWRDRGSAWRSGP